jgi:hypothetical protein
MIKKANIKAKILHPVREQLEMLVEYVDILEKKKVQDWEEELTHLMAIIISTKKMCLLYINDLIKIKGKKDGRDYTL